MRRLILFILILAIAGAGMLSCSTEEEPPPPPPKEYLPCEVGFLGVGFAHTAKDLLALETILTINNVNDFEVMVESLRFNLSSEGTVVGSKGSWDKAYIPAGEEITLRYITFAPLNALMLHKLSAGMGPKEAGGVIMPLWGKMSQGVAPYMAEGEAEILSDDGERMTVPFKLTWQMK